MKKFIVLVVVVVVAVGVAVVSSSVVKRDMDVEWEDAYNEHKCWPGFDRDEIPKQFRKARKFCKGQNITDPLCYKACLYDQVGTFKEGKYQKKAADALIINMFVFPMGAPVSDQWSSDTAKCAKKTAKELEVSYPTDYNGDCGSLKEFEDCMELSRDCEKAKHPPGMKIPKGMKAAALGMPSLP